MGERRRSLEVRVVSAAQAALAEQNYVSPGYRLHQGETYQRHGCQERGPTTFGAILGPVASQREAAARPDELDLWIAEVGEDYVADLVESTRQGVAQGTIPLFGDKESFLRHLTRPVLDKPA